MGDPRATLAAATGVDDWTLTRTVRVEEQRYLLADRPEMMRSVESHGLAATVYHDHDRGRGRGRFTLSGREAAVDARAIDAAVFAASLQANEPWSLPGPAPVVAVALADPELERSPARALDTIEERLRAAVAREDGVRLTAAEVFLQRSETELTTSAGVEVSRSATSLMLDLVLLARRGDDETESHVAYTVRRLADLDVEGIVARHAERARHALVATLPASHVGAVLLSERSFLPLFAPFRYATSAESVFQGVSPLAVGAPLLGEREVKGERLDLTSDATLDWGGESTPFDEDGLALGPVPVVTGGEVSALAASKRYADYLGVAPTGAWHNTVVAGGESSSDQLRRADDGRVIEIVEFSWLNPDRVRGRFSTEIRLAYEHGPGGSRPLSGGAFAGNVYDLFADVRLARETALTGSFFGPIALRFGRGQITGAS